MLERERIIAELWARLAAVDGVQYTARNPVNPPSRDDMPCIQFFEMDDTVVVSQTRGAHRHPAYKRELTVVMEAFQVGASEDAATQALGLFVQSLKKSLYVDGNTLGFRGVEILEKEASRILRPPNVEMVAGIGIVLGIRYVEDISELFVT